MARRARPDVDKMSFLEHIEELRTRLIRALVAIVLAVGVCWNWAAEILHFMMQPLRAAAPKIRFIYTGPTEGFVLYMKAAFFAGIFLSAPFVLYQVWAFVSPGLYGHEKRYVVPFVTLGSLFFVIGGAFGHYCLFPATFRFLGQFTGEDIDYVPRLTEYFSFYFWFVLGLGLVFQLPVVIFFLARIGVVTAGFLMRNFKYAVLIAFIIAAVVTPSSDVVNQTMLAVPIIALYLLGVGAAWLFGKPRKTAGRVEAALLLAVSWYASREYRRKRAVRLATTS